MAVAVHPDNQLSAISLEITLFLPDGKIFYYKRLSGQRGSC